MQGNNTVAAGNGMQGIVKIAGMVNRSTVKVVTASCADCCSKAAGYGRVNGYGNSNDAVATGYGVQRVVIATGMDKCGAIKIIAATCADRSISAAGYGRVNG